MESQEPTTIDGNLDHKRQQIDDWLPLTSTRNAKWWHCTFHNVTVMVGAGVLTPPHAMSQFGWGPGVVILALSWVITLFTLWQMIEMHELVPGRRFDRYHELIEYAFNGKRLRLYIAVPQQLICEVGVDIVYMLIGGKSLQMVHIIICKYCKPMKTAYFTIIFASVQFLLSHFPNINSICGVSLAAAVMSFSLRGKCKKYKMQLPLMIVMQLLYHCLVGFHTQGCSARHNYDKRASSTKGLVFHFFSALGNVAFAYAGHNVVLEIQATIPSTTEKPSKVSMWKGVLIAYIVVAFFYFPVALLGYYIFGDKVQDNILISLEKPAWLMVMANIFVIIHVMGSYQLYAMPVFGMIESVLVKKLNFRPTLIFWFISHNIYIAFTMFVAITFPSFGGLVGFFGGFASSPTYFLPCVMWLTIFKPRKFSLSWCINWMCIILGVLLKVLSVMGGLRTIILHVKYYS